MGARGPSLADIQAEEQLRSKQQRSSSKAQGGSSRGTTMAERIAAKNGGSSSSWGSGSAVSKKQTAQLKSLLGVETPPPGQQVGSHRNPNNPPKAKKSLLQIQNDEVRQNAAQQKARTQGRAAGGPKAGSWGAVASSGVPQQQAPRVTRPTQPKSSPIQTRQQQKQSPRKQQQQGQTGGSNGDGDSALWDYQEDGTTAAPKATNKAPAQPPQRTARAASTQGKDFGGQDLPPGMAKWASDELQKLRGNRDLTLVHFCMTLQASADIREYMREFLGSTPNVSSFASEFIKRKRAAKKSKKGKRN